MQISLPVRLRDSTQLHLVTDAIVHDHLRSCLPAYHRRTSITHALYIQLDQTCINFLTAGRVSSEVQGR